MTLLPKEYCSVFISISLSKRLNLTVSSTRIVSCLALPVGGTHYLAVPISLIWHYAARFENWNYRQRHLKKLRSTRFTYLLPTIWYLFPNTHAWKVLKHSSKLMKRKTSKTQENYQIFHMMKEGLGAVVVGKIWNSYFVLIIFN